MAYDYVLLRSAQVEYTEIVKYLIGYKIPAEVRDALFERTKPMEEEALLVV